MPLGAAVSGLFNLGAGLIGSSATQQSNKVQAQAAAANIENQRLFAKKGIRWRVDDAKKAGIHPLYALGANTTSFSPVSVGHTPDTSMANALAQTGQDVSRAIDATRTHPERIDAFTQSVRDLSLQKMGLENELLGAQIAKIRQTSVPALPSTAPNQWLIDGQGQTAAALAPGLVDDQPLERVVGDPAAPHREPGAITDLGYVRTPGGYMPVMSKDAKERLEEDWPGMLAWNLRNRLMPTLGLNQQRPPDSLLPDGYDFWTYNPIYQEYRPGKYPDWHRRLQNRR